MNTALDVLYRDASNFKLSERVVLPGEISPEQIDAVRAHLDEGLYFIPTQLGWAHLGAGAHQRYGWALANDDDHVWHELEGITLTADPATMSTPVDEFVERFCATVWDASAEAERLGIDAATRSR